MTHHRASRRAAGPPPRAPLARAAALGLAGGAEPRRAGGDGDGRRGDGRPLRTEALGALSLGFAVVMPLMIAGIGCTVGIVAIAAREHGAGGPDLPARRCAACTGRRWSASSRASWCSSPARCSGRSARRRSWSPGAPPSPGCRRRALFQIVFAAATFYLEGTGRARPGLVAMAGANLVNFGLSWLLIGGRMGFPELGAPGAALASTLARAVSPASWSGCCACPSSPASAAPARGSGAPAAGVRGARCARSASPAAPLTSSRPWPSPPWPRPRASRRRGARRLHHPAQRRDHGRPRPLESRARAAAGRPRARAPRPSPPLPRWAPPSPPPPLGGQLAAHVALSCLGSRSLSPRPLPGSGLFLATAAGCHRRYCSGCASRRLVAADPPPLSISRLPAAGRDARRRPRPALARPARLRLRAAPGGHRTHPQPPPPLDGISRDLPQLRRRAARPCLRRAPPGAPPSRDRRAGPGGAARGRRGTVKTSMKVRPKLSASRGGCGRARRRASRGRSAAGCSRRGARRSGTSATAARRKRRAEARAGRGRAGRGRARAAPPAAARRGS